MTRYGDDDRDAYDDTVRPNAVCFDCGADYSKAEDDPTVCCDPCSEKRDDWANRYELRMATAQPARVRRKGAA